MLGFVVVVLGFVVVGGRGWVPGGAVAGGPTTGGSVTTGSSGVAAPDRGRLAATGAFVVVGVDEVVVGADVVVDGSGRVVTVVPFTSTFGGDAGVSPPVPTNAYVAPPIPTTRSTATTATPILRLRYVDWRRARRDASSGSGRAGNACGSGSPNSAASRVAPSVGGGGNRGSDGGAAAPAPSPKRASSSSDGS